MIGIGEHQSAVNENMPFGVCCTSDVLMRLVPPGEAGIKKIVSSGHRNFTHSITERKVGKGKNQPVRMPIS